MSLGRWRKVVLFVAGRAAITRQECLCRIQNYSVPDRACNSSRDLIPPFEISLNMRSVVRTMDRLVREGMLKRETRGRAYAYRLTDDGWDVQDIILWDLYCHSAFFRWNTDSCRLNNVVRDIQQRRARINVLNEQVNALEACYINIAADFDARLRNLRASSPVSDSMTLAIDYAARREAKLTTLVTS